MERRNCPSLSLSIHGTTNRSRIISPSGADWLQDGEVDMCSAGLTRTFERDEAVSFGATTRVYRDDACVEARFVLFTRTGSEDCQSLRPKERQF